MHSEKHAIAHHPTFLIGIHLLSQKDLQNEEESFAFATCHTMHSILIFVLTNPALRDTGIVLTVLDILEREGDIQKAIDTLQAMTVNNQNLPEGRTMYSIVWSSLLLLFVAYQAVIDTLLQKLSLLHLQVQTSLVVGRPTKQTWYFQVSKQIWQKYSSKSDIAKMTALNAELRFSWRQNFVFRMLCRVCCR